MRAALAAIAVLEPDARARIRAGLLAAARERALGDGPQGTPGLDRLRERVRTAR